MVVRYPSKWDADHHAWSLVSFSVAIPERIQFRLGVLTYAHYTPPTPTRRTQLDSRVGGVHWALAVPAQHCTVIRRRVAIQLAAGVL